MVATRRKSAVSYKEASDDENDGAFSDAGVVVATDPDSGEFERF